jgi:hypothetical protein
VTAGADFAARAAEVAGYLSDRLAAPPLHCGDHDDWRHQSLSRGAAGIALLHGVRAQAGYGGLDRAHAWLSLAARGPISTGAGAGLWFGAPAVAFATRVGARGHYPAAIEALSQAIAGMTESRLQAAHRRIADRTRPSLSEFDLVRGLTGLGSYFLHCEPGSPLLRRILAYLVRLTEPVPADDAPGTTAPGWWSLDNPATGTETDGGHANLGMAHGIAGPLALLALATRNGITISGQDEAIDRICAWLDDWRQTGTVGAWWPHWITLADLRGGATSQVGPGRPSWCYGTPGLARAQQLAGIARHDTARKADAESALARCLSDPAQTAQLSDPGLCHGWAGVAATSWHAAQDADISTLGAVTESSSRALAESARGDHPDGLMQGYAGAALTMHAIATVAPGSWPGCLLLT